MEKERGSEMIDSAKFEEILGLLEESGFGSNYAQPLVEGRPSGPTLLSMLVPFDMGSDAIHLLRTLREKMRRFLVATTVIEANNPPEEED